MSARRHWTYALVAAVLASLVLGSAACRRTRLAPRTDGAAVVLAPEPGADPGLTVLDEVEPNDLLANAQLISPAAGATIAVTGHLIAPPGAKAKDVDLYRVVVAPPPVVTENSDGAARPPRQRLSIEARSGATPTVSIDALDDQGRILVGSVGSSPDEPEGIPNLAVTPGTYFVRVKPGAPAPVKAVGSAAGSDGGQSAGAFGYRLTIRLLAFETGDEVEPNGKATLAEEVTAGSEVAGFFGWRHDEDWFRLPLGGLPEGSVLSADLDPPEGVAATIAVYDSVEHKLTEQRGKKGDRVALRNVRLPSSDPNMFVVVKAESGQNVQARYSLRLRTEEARTDAELEPNDDPTHAVPIGDGNFIGYLGAGDVDVYRYTSALPAELDFEVAPPERVDLKVEVLRDDAVVLAKVDVGKRREAERLPNLYVSGSVLLRLSAGKGDGNLDEPYHIRASSRPVEPGAEREPNNTSPLATLLPAGTTGTGLVFPRGDVDFWMTQTAAGAGGSVAISVRGVPGLGLDVRVQNNAGKELGHFRVAGESSAPTRLNVGETACCIVQVREASGRLGNPRDRYTLTVLP